MEVKKKVKLTTTGMVIISLIICLILFGSGFFIYHQVIKSNIMKLGYSEASTKEIIRLKLTDKIQEIGSNDALNHVFTDSEFRLDYLERYREIPYFEAEDFTSICNSFIESGYSNDEIRAIIEGENVNDIRKFSEKGHVSHITDFYSIPYAKLSNYDRYVRYQNENLTSYEETVVQVNIGLDKEFYVDSDVIRDFSVTVLANKYHQLGETYVPDELKTIDSKYYLASHVKAGNIHHQLTSVAVSAFEKMAEDALKEDMTLKVRSSYRSYQEQDSLYQEYVEKYGVKRADELAARPGFSEHQTGLALDIAVSEDSTFASTKEFKWMQEHAYLYGFVLRYPKAKTDITGYSYESWHYRYVGVEIATYMKEHNLTYDEYYVMFLDK